MDIWDSSLLAIIRNKEYDVISSDLEDLFRTQTYRFGVAYAIWKGLGIVLTAMVSIFIFKQKLDLPAMLGISIIIVGVLVINIFSKSSAH